MISLICFILTLAGSVNWFCIGVLQYDFVAGLFGSQANVFSRIIYALIGLSSIWLIVAVIKGRGKLKISGKDNSDKDILKKKRATETTEAGNMYSPSNKFNGFGEQPFSNYPQHSHFEPNVQPNSNYNQYSQNTPHQNFENNKSDNQF